MSREVVPEYKVEPDGDRGFVVWRVVAGMYHFVSRYGHPGEAKRVANELNHWADAEVIL